MQLAFCLYKYFPFGGLQRDFLRIALACQARGAFIRVYVIEWTGEVPPGFEICIVPVRAVTNAGKYRKFSSWVEKDLENRPVDRVIGFNKMPGLDVYFAADPCFEERSRRHRGRFYRLSARYRHFAEYESAVFAPDAQTEILTISSAQQPVFEDCYHTPPERFHLLPPGIDRDRSAPPDFDDVRAAFRKEFGLDGDSLLLLQIGSGFRTKGLDRSLRALAGLPPGLRRRTRLIAIGQDNPAPFRRLAASLGVADRIEILPGRDDIPRFLFGADLLVHPAYSEAAGMVLLEALVAGLPVLASAVCGYAHYITESGGGLLVGEPFAQQEMDALLVRMLENDGERAVWRKSALEFAATADIFGKADRAADIIMAGAG
jgi:UDP-glucose:(heptosyl)LPS alpha-1,3-glucosyltransferase